MVAFGLVQRILDVIEEVADRMLLCGQAIEERLQLFAAQLFEIFDLTFSNYWHDFLFVYFLLRVFRGFGS